MLSDKMIDFYEQVYTTAMDYPEAYEEQPWGFPLVKVRKKVFLFLSSVNDDQIHVSVKLPQSADEALALECAQPTGHGLGRARWVTLTIRTPTDIELGVVLGWLDESYRAIAPKKLVSTLP